MSNFQDEERNTNVGTISVQSILKSSSVGNVLSEEDPILTKLIIESLETMDDDGDGRINAKEIALSMTKIVKAYHKTQKKNQNLKYAVLLLSVLAIILTLSTFGTSMAAAYLSKDTKVRETSLLNKEDQPVATAINEVDIPLAALAFLDADIIGKVDTVAFTSMDGSTIYYRKVSSIDIQDSKFLSLRTTEGDTLMWNRTKSPEDIHVELKDNSSWKRSTLCDKCTMTNVYESDEVKDGIEEFLVAVHGSSASRRKLWFGTKTLKKNGGFNNNVPERMFNPSTCKW